MPPFELRSCFKRLLQVCVAICLVTALYDSSISAQETTESVSPEESLPTLESEEKGASPPENENYSLSAAVARNYDLDKLIRSIIEGIQSENHAMVAELITEGLSKPDERYVEFRGTLHRLRPLIRQIIRALPDLTLKAYRRQASQSANAAFVDAVQSGDIFELKRVATEFPNTVEGDRATGFLIASYQDQGDLEKAALLLQNVIQGSNLPAATGLNQRRLARLQARLPHLLNDDQSNKALPNNFRPSAIPLWSTRNDISPGSIELIEAGHRDLRENGLTPFSPWTAQANGQILFTVTPIQFEARDRASGELVWSRPLPQYSARILSKLTAADNPLRSWNISQSVLFRIFGESLYSSFSQVENFVYLIEENPAGTVAEEGDLKNRTVANEIVCLDASSGQEVWKNSSVNESKAYLCSPPQVWGDELLVLAEYRGNPQIQLIALDKKTGEFLRGLPLAEIARPVEAEAFTERDGRRQKLACPIKITGSKAYCPTGAGVLAAIDLLDWSVEWVYRYPRHDVQSSGTGLGRPKIGLTGYQWWSDWHEIQNVVFAEYIAFASPEYDKLILLNRHTGEVLWTASREDSLYVAAANTDIGIILVGNDYARAYAINTGEILWKTPLSFPVGRGILIGDSYVLPDSELGWSSLDIKTGEITESPLNLSSQLVTYSLPDVSTPRNFVTLDDELYEISFRGIKRIQSVEAVSKKADSLSLTHRFLHHIEDGSNKAEFDPQVFLREKDFTEKPLRRLFDQELLKRISSNSSASMESLHALPISEEFTLNWFCNRLENSLAKKEMETARDLLTNHLSVSLMSSFRTNRKSRSQLDRWLLSTLKQAYSSYAPKEKSALDETIQAAMNSRLLDHPSDNEFFIGFFKGTPWELATTEDAVISPEIQKIIEDKIHHTEEVARKSVFLKVDVDESGQWSANEPKVTSISRLSANVFFESVPIKNIDGTPYTDLNLEIEFPGHRGVRFFGKHWSRPWPAYLPRTERSLRIEGELVNAWAIGQLIVLQVGSEVYGFSPFTAEGHRGAKLLWPAKGESIDTLGDRSNHMLSFQTKAIPERIGFPKSPAQRMNEYGHYATAVGPVRAGYFCIQQKGMLVALETATGKEIWRRYDLPEQAECFGDEEHVVVIDRLEHRIQTLSALDGTEVTVRNSPTSNKAILSSSGVHCLLESGTGRQNATRLLKQDQPTEKLTLEWVNLVNDEFVWKRTWNEPAIPFEIDSHWLGVCLVSGQIEIVDLETGNLVASHTVDLPTEISKIASHVSDQNFLVLVSGKITDEKLLNATQQNGGYRRTLTDGPVFCFDRADASLLWTNQLENAVVPLEQPVDLPVFVTAGSRFPEEIMDDRSPGSRIQMFNRQTGKLLYESESLSPSSRFSVDGHIESGKVTLTTREAIVTVDYLQQAE